MMYKAAFFIAATIETSVPVSRATFNPDVFLDCQYTETTNRNYQDRATCDNIREAVLMEALT